MIKCIHYIDKYMSNGGGMSLFVGDIAIDEIIITVETNRMDVRVKKITLEKNFIKKDEFLSIIKLENPEVVILHTLKYLNKNLIKEIRKENHKVILIVHDYYPICEKNVLLNNRKQICSGPYEKNCIYCYYDKFKIFIPLDRNIRNLLHPFYSLFLRKVRWYETRLEHNNAIISELDLIVFPTHKVKTIMSRFIDPSIKSAVIRHFQRVCISRREKPEKCEFAFIGHDSYHKGFELIKKIYKDFKFGNMKIHLFGEFKSIIRSQNLLYEGTFENKNLSSPFSKFDVLLFPSIWPETSGRVITEAASCGKYIIASNITSAKEILGEYEGLILVENNEPISLRMAMEKIYSEWDKKKYPLLPVKFKSVIEYREKIFNILGGKNVGEN